MIIKKYNYTSHSVDTGTELHLVVHYNSDILQSKGAITVHPGRGGLSIRNYAKNDRL